MGQIISQSEVTTFYNTYKIAVIGIVAPVILGVWLHYSVFKKPSEGQLVISYDDDDDLDENTIVSLIDKQFSIGKFPKLREKFNNLRRQLLRGYNKNTQMPYEKCVEYINLVLDYDNQLGQALEKNLEDLADIYSIRQEDIRRSQSKYINNSNSHKLLARNEVLQAEIPTFLSQEVALEIKHEMEEYAYRQQQWFMEFLINNQRGQDFSQVSENRRLQAEDIIDASNIGYDDEDQNDPDQIVYKSTTVAKYITLDMILDKEHKINEAQLKRMLQTPMSIFIINRYQYQLVNQFIVINKINLKFYQKIPVDLTKAKLYFYFDDFKNKLQIYFNLYYNYQFNLYFFNLILFISIYIYQFDYSGLQIRL